MLILSTFYYDRHFGIILIIFQGCVLEIFSEEDFEGQSTKCFDRCDMTEDGYDEDLFGNDKAQSAKCSCSPKNSNVWDEIQKSPSKKELYFEDEIGKQHICYTFM